MLFDKKLDIKHHCAEKKKKNLLCSWKLELARNQGGNYFFLNFLHFLVKIEWKQNFNVLNTVQHFVNKQHFAH